MSDRKYRQHGYQNSAKPSRADARGWAPSSSRATRPAHPPRSAGPERARVPRGRAVRTLWHPRKPSPSGPTAPAGPAARRSTPAPSVRRSILARYSSAPSGSRRESVLRMPATRASFSRRAIQVERETGFHAGQPPFRRRARPSTTSSISEAARRRSKRRLDRGILRRCAFPPRYPWS